MSTPWPDISPPGETRLGRETADWDRFPANDYEAPAVPPAEREGYQERQLRWGRQLMAQVALALGKKVETRVTTRVVRCGLVPVVEFIPVELWLPEVVARVLP